MSVFVSLGVHMSKGSGGGQMKLSDPLEVAGVTGTPRGSW